MLFCYHRMCEEQSLNQTVEEIGLLTWIGLETGHLHIKQTLEFVLNQLHETISQLPGSYGTTILMSSRKKTSDATQGAD